ncbi:MAG TPA: hypothetical protein VNM37_09650, partial [Candidatus Dormibacteraeota bacterium]|nr:hypothetical protein [Candidatus Dormibacteraeota bacterium]
MVAPNTIENPSASMGGAESLEQARAIGDTFSGGDVFWDNALGSVYGKASGETNQDYLHVYSDKTNHLQVLDSTKDGAGTVRPISFQLGGLEAIRIINNTNYPSLVMGAAAPGTSEDQVFFKVTGNFACKVRQENLTAGSNSHTGFQCDSDAASIEMGATSSAWVVGTSDIQPSTNFLRSNLTPSNLDVISRGNGNFRILTGSAGSAVARFRIDTNGISYFTPLGAGGNNLADVRIQNAAAGTASAAVLHMDSNGAGQGLFLQTSTTYTPGGALVPNTTILFGYGNDLGLASGGTGTSIKFWTGPLGAEVNRMTIANDGHVTIQGKLTVVGAIDPPSISLSGGTALFFESDDGKTAPVSAASTGRIRYNDTTKAWQQSVDGGAYFGFGGGAGSDTTAWHNTGDSFGATKIFGSTDNNDVQVYTNNTARGAWLKTGEFLVGATALTGHAGDQEQILLKKDFSGSTILRLENYNTTVNGQAEATLMVANANNVGAIMLVRGPNAATQNGYSANEAIFSTYGVTAGLVIRASGGVPIRIVGTVSGADTEIARWITGGALLLNATAQVENEGLRNNGKFYCDGYIRTASGAYLGIGLAPTHPIDIRADLSGTSGNGITYDNRHATGDTYLRIGNDPIGTQKSIVYGYYNGDNTGYAIHNGDGTFTIGCAANQNVNLLSNNTVRIIVTNDGGIQVGAPTGGSKGAGTVNVAGDIYKNGMAY